MKVKIRKSTLAKGFLIFILLSTATMVGILIWTTDTETWTHLKDFNWSFIPVLLVISAVRWLFDGMAFVSLARHHRKSTIHLGRASIIRLEGSLIANVVPVLLGTFSMHAYLLHKEKIKLSETMAITVLRAILPIFIFLLNIPILIFMKSDPASDTFFAEFVKVVSPAIAIIVMFFIFTLFYPQYIKRIASAIVRGWGRFRFVHVEKMFDVEERLFHEIDQFSHILWKYIKERKMIVLEASWWILAAFIADYFIAIGIMWGFGFQPHLLRALLVQFLIRPIIFLAPTPGGAGVWDFTYLGFFSLFMPQSLIGIAVLLWRILVTHIPLLVGAFFLSREFHKDGKLREIILEKGELPEEKKVYEESEISHT